MTKNNFFLAALFLLGSFISAQAQCDVCNECETSTETAIPFTFTEGFDDGSGFSFGEEFAMGLLPGANNAFGGSLSTVNGAIASAALADLCLTGDFTVTAANPADYPLTVEFRIENSQCGFFPCPWIDFNTVVSADGTVSLGGALTSGNIGMNGIFDPAGANPSIVTAVANFSGTPTAGDVTITYANIALAEVSCAPIAGCIPTGGGASACATCEECEDLVETVIPNTFDTGFSSGSGNSFGEEFAMGLLTGANDDFAGSIRLVDPAVASSNFGDLCLTGDFVVTADDPSIYPITVEYRIENGGCGFFPCPWTDFNTAVFADGPITLGGNLSSGNTGANGPFDPAAGSAAIVTAIANFSGTPIAAGVTITYSNLQLVDAVCEAIPGCMVGTPDCEGVVGGTATPGTACDDGNAATGNDTYDANCNCVGMVIPVDCEGTPNGTVNPGSACDDGNPNTGNDTFDAACNCVGQAIDCEGTPGGSAGPGTACDDLNPNTGNDTYDANCQCVGQVFDCEGTPGGGALPGTTCDDLNPMTTGDVWLADCTCAGSVTFDCPALNLNIGDACNDGNPNTTNDIVNSACACAGVVVFDCPSLSANIGDSCDDGNPNTGNDTVQPACVCMGLAFDCAGTPGGAAGPLTPCDDGNPVTVGDTFDANCNCIGQVVDCAGVAGGNAMVDCNNDCNGTAFVDGCGTCVGGNTGLTACPLDCAGVAGGTAVADCNGDCNGTAGLDACGNCVGGNTGLVACVNDCAGVPGGTAVIDCNNDCNGTAFIDNCNTCVGGNTGLMACLTDCAGTPGGAAVVDCNGDCNGTASIDVCGNCVGGSTGLTACVDDCAGVPGGTAVVDCNNDCNGTAFIDNCNTCVGGNTGLMACLTDCAGTPGGAAVVDCNGDCNGTASIDVCGNCVGGNTGLTACVDDCAGVPGGTAVMDCAGVCNGTAFVDNCNTCVGGSTGLMPCPTDCAGTPGGTAVVDCNGDCNGTAGLDACGNCVGGNTGQSPCIVDCAGTPGGNAVPDCNGDCNGIAYIDTCGVCVDGFSGNVACQANCTDIPGFDVCNCGGLGNLVLDSSPCFVPSDLTQTFLLVDVVNSIITTDADSDQVIAMNTSINFNAPTGDYVIYNLIAPPGLVSPGTPISSVINIFTAQGATMTSPGVLELPDGSILAASGLITVNADDCACTTGPEPGGDTSCPNGGACIGDFVFCDTGGIGNITMALYDTNGTLIATDVTDMSGAYNFCNLPAGNYQIVSGTVPGAVNVGPSFLNVSVGQCEINGSADFEYSSCGSATGGGGGGGGGLNCSDITLTQAIQCQTLNSYTVTLSFGGTFDAGGYTITRPDGSMVSVTGNGYTDDNIYSTVEFPSYAYTVTSNIDPTCSASTGTILAICTPPSAIELVEFDGTEAGKANYLHWTTASETDNSHFTLMRSDNGQDYEVVSVINSQGNSSSAQHYEYSDFEYRSNTSYYRLLETDFDGNSNYAEGVVIIERKEFEFSINNVYPVPSSSIVNIDFVTSKREVMAIKVFDVTGKQLEQFDVEALNGDNTLELNINHYSIGTYFVTISSGSEVRTAKFVKD